MDKSSYFFKITYFNPSGKYYTEAIVVWKVRGLSNGMAYYQDAIAKLRGLIDHEQPLPGLVGCWSGPILIEQCQPCLNVDNPNINNADDWYADGVPTLLIPTKLPV